MLYAKMTVDDAMWSFYIVRYFEDRDGGDNLVMRVERQKDDEAFSEWVLPDISCKKSYGFSEMEIGRIRNFIRNNQFLIWKIWEEGEETSA